VTAISGLWLSSAYKSGLSACSFSASVLFGCAWLGGGSSSSSGVSSSNGVSGGRWMAQEVFGQERAWALEGSGSSQPMYVAFFKRGRGRKAAPQSAFAGPFFSFWVFYGIGGSTNDPSRGRSGWWCATTVGLNSARQEDDKGCAGR